MTTFADFKRDIDRLTHYDHETEYIGDDGLIHCTECGEPKQELPEAYSGCAYHLIQQNAMPRLCRCERDKADADRARIVADEIARRTASTRKECFGKSRYINATFKSSDDDSEQYGKCLAYAEEFRQIKPDGLLLYGAVGAGKTHLAACVANRVIDDGFRAKFTSVSSLSGMVTAAYGNINVLDSLLDYDLVVIDDLGTERADERTAERLFYIVDLLIDNDVAMVITSNLDLKAIADAEQPGYRTYSRILGACIRLKAFDGADRRKVLGMDKAKRFKQILDERTGK